MKLTEDQQEVHDQIVYMSLVMYSAIDKNPDRVSEIYRVIRSYADVQGISGTQEEVKEFVDHILEQVGPALETPEDYPFVLQCMEDGQKLKMTSQHVADQYAAAGEMVSDAFNLSREELLNSPDGDIEFLPQSLADREEMVIHLSKFFPWLDPEKPGAWTDLDHCEHVNLLSPIPMFCFYDHPNSLFCVPCAGPIVDESEEKALCDICREPVRKDGWITSSYAYGPIIFIGSFCESCAQKEASAVTK